MEKILTVVIPTYNMEKYLKKCLSSLVVSADCTPLLEVLCVNDGSKDKSSEIAHEFQNRYPEVFRVIDKINGNYGSCVNCGLREAKGKYIKILDADDSFMKKGLEKIIEYLKGTDVDLIVTDFVIDQINNHKKINISYDIPHGKILKFCDVATKKCFIDIMMHAVTYKTKILREINYAQTEGISYTDQEWIFLPMSNVKTLIYFDIPVYIYLIGREGQTVDPKVSIKACSQRERILFREIEQYKSNSQRLSDDQKFYLIGKMMFLVHEIYTGYIIKSKMIDSVELKSFDKQLELASSLLYDNANKLLVYKLNRLEYVRIWRTNNYLRQIPLRFFAILFQFIGNAKRKLKW